MPAAVRFPRRCERCRSEQPLHSTFVNGEGWRALCWACGEQPSRPRLTLVKG